MVEDIEIVAERDEILLAPGLRNSFQVYLIARPAARDRTWENVVGARFVNLWKRPAILAGTLVCAVALELAATSWQWLSVPSEDDWRKVAAAVRAVRQAGEPILIAPAWVDPVARHYLGSLTTLDDATLSDVDRFARVWQVSIRGKDHPFLNGLAASERRRFGAVELGRFDKVAEIVVRDFTADFARAEVVRVGSEGERPCTPGARGRSLCNSAVPALWVGPHLAEVDFRPYRCVLVPPVADEIVRLRFAGTPSGARLVVYTGLDDVTSRKVSQAPVRLTIRIDGRERGTFIHKSDAPWTRRELAWPQEGSAAAVVEFDVSAESVSARTFCFHAEVRAAPAAGEVKP